jgi:outer membrane protein assembly factor BamB
MKNKISKKISIIFCLTIMLFVSTITPVIVGYKTITISNNEKLNIEKRSFYSFHDSEIAGYGPIPSYEYNDFIDIESEKVNILKETSKPLDGLMDSAWPMYCHDVRHTGRSPYSTADNPGVEKWRFDTIDSVTGSSVIDDQGVIYVAASDLYAVYPNGTLKWRFETPFWMEIAPAIDENGVIYVGTVYAGDNYLYAIYTSNGSLKWLFNPGTHIASSPAIGDDGTIYFGCYNGNIYALYPNGTLKWVYTTDYIVLSSPAIGPDGTIYCGSHDYNLYALYPNGTLKWTFPTGYYVRVSPCVGDDGTIYCVSRDGYLYSVYPNGTMMWRTGVGAGESPTIGQDGTIYAGWRDLYAVNPTNGSVKWVFDLGPDTTIDGTPCNSVDGTIFFGTHIGEYDGGELIAVNPDGTERWRIYLATNWIMSAPAIGSDGTVYVGSYNDGPPYGWGFLHAIKNNPYAPSVPEISGPIKGKPNVEHTFTFCSTSPVGKDLYYMIDWGAEKTGWHGPYPSGETISLTHSWYIESDKIIRAWVRDTDNNYGGPGEFSITINPRSRAFDTSLLLRYLEKFLLSVTMPLDLQISQSNSLQISQHSSDQLLLKILLRFGLK